MANDISKLLVGKPNVTGGIYTAPLGTTIPEDANDELDPAFVAVGYASDDGVVKGESRDTDTITAWGGDTVAIVQTGITITLAFTLLQLLDPVAIKAVYGDTAVTSTAATAEHGNQVALKVTADTPPHRVWLIDVFNNGKRARLVMPDGQVTDTDDQSFVDNDVASMGVTVTGFPDAAGAYLYLYGDDGAKTAA